MRFLLRDSSSRRCGRLFGFTRCVAIAGRMSCDKQRVAVRILFAPVIILRVGTEAARPYSSRRRCCKVLAKLGSRTLLEEEVGDEEDAGFDGPCVAALSDYLSVFLEEGSSGGSIHRPTLALPFCSRSSVGRVCGGARQEASVAA